MVYASVNRLQSIGMELVMNGGGAGLASLSAVREKRQFSACSSLPRRPHGRTPFNTTSTTASMEAPALQRFRTLTKEQPTGKRRVECHIVVRGTCHTINEVVSK
ncbi:unnamed protein product, partial [Laminaria digitata]